MSVAETYKNEYRAKARELTHSLSVLARFLMLQKPPSNLTMHMQSGKIHTLKNDLTEMYSLVQTIEGELKK